MQTKTTSSIKKWLLTLLMLVLGIALIGAQKKISAMEPEVQQPSQKKTPIAQAAPLNLQEAEKYTYAPQAILIFLDELEKKELVCGAISNIILAALTQKAGPFITSTSSLQLIFEEYNKDIPTSSCCSDLFENAANKSGEEETEALIKIFEAEKNKQVKGKNTPANIACKYITLKAIQFKPDEWIIKKINDHLCLFVPIIYLESRSINPDAVRQDSTLTTTAVELQMGLKVNHMKTVTIEDILQKQTVPQRSTAYFTKALYDGSTQASTIFCIHSDYRNQNIPLPLWTIYLTGHGGNIKIAGMSTEDFKKILDPLENKINCRLFIYSSCCAAGLNIESVYKNVTSNLQNRYSFPIIVIALTDATIIGITTKLANDNFNNLTLHTQDTLSFAQFFQTATQQRESFNYHNIIKQVEPLPSEPNNMPQVKLPGLEWFLPIDKASFVSIGETLTKTRKSDQPLNIKNFFKTDPKVILLYAANIPFELKLDDTHLDAIVSMIPGNAAHIIKKISSTTQPAIALVDTFMKNTMNAREKIILIKEIQGSDKSINDVIIYYKPLAESCAAYFVDGNQVWFKRSLKSSLENASIKSHNGDMPYIKRYQSYLEKVTGEPQRIERAYYNPIIFTETELDYQELNGNFLEEEQIRLDGLLPLGKRCIINIIEERSQPLTNLFQAVRNTQPDDAITLIKQCTGINDILELTIPNPIITINNVIIQKNKDEALFSFDGKFYQDGLLLHQDYLPEYIQILTQHIPFDQRKGSLLPSTITSEGIEKIKAIAPRAKPAKIEKQKYQKNPQGKWRQKKEELTSSAPQEAERR